MRTCLVSDLPEFYSALDGHESISLCRGNPDGQIPEADLYIWDYSEHRIKPDALPPAAQHLILVNPKDLADLQRLEPSVCILLKPVSPHTLRTFVDLALRTWKLRAEACLASTLRSDRDALLQYVLEVNLKLQEYDHERSNFLARALHDLRTPLTALHGYCGLLAEGKLGSINASQRELLERMRNSTTRLTRLTAGTLDLLMQGHFEKPPQYRAADIDATIHRAVHDVHPLIEDKKIEVNLWIETPPSNFPFEPEQIQQVLVNLLENSCKFVPRNGKIDIHSYPTGRCSQPEMQANPSEGESEGPDVYRIDVDDSGPGVASELVDKIFEQYASYAGSYDRSGGGLGLAICKRIISAHRGKIWATAGQGGHFSVILPLQQNQEKPDEANATEQSLEPESVGC